MNSNFDNKEANNIINSISSIFQSMNISTYSSPRLSTIKLLKKEIQQYYMSKLEEYYNNIIINELKMNISCTCICKTENIIENISANIMINNNRNIIQESFCNKLFHCIKFNNNNNNNKNNNNNINNNVLDENLNINKSIKGLLRSPLTNSNNSNITINHINNLIKFISTNLNYIVDDENNINVSKYFNINCESNELFEFMLDCNTSSSSETKNDNIKYNFNVVELDGLFIIHQYDKNNENENTILNNKFSNSSESKDSHLLFQQWSLFCISLNSLSNYTSKLTWTLANHNEVVAD
jgi:hypothetical protein